MRVATKRAGILVGSEAHSALVKERFADRTRTEFTQIVRFSHEGNIGRHPHKELLMRIRKSVVDSSGKNRATLTKLALHEDSLVRNYAGDALGSIAETIAKKKGNASLNSLGWVSFIMREPKDAEHKHQHNLSWGNKPPSRAVAGLVELADALGKSIVPGGSPHTFKGKALIDHVQNQTPINLARQYGLIK